MHSFPFSSKQHRLQSIPNVNLDKTAIPTGN